jgi:hypothetical protein
VEQIRREMEADPEWETDRNGNACMFDPGLRWPEARGILEAERQDSLNN